MTGTEREASPQVREDRAAAKQQAGNAPCGPTDLGARARENEIKRQTPKLPKPEHKESDRNERNKDPSVGGRNHQGSGVRQEWRPVASVAQDFARQGQRCG